jgi:hypothetical protein
MRASLRGNCHRSGSDRESRAIYPELSPVPARSSSPPSRAARCLAPGLCPSPPPSAVPAPAAPPPAAAPIRALAIPPTSLRAPAILIPDRMHASALVGIPPAVFLAPRLSVPIPPLFFARPESLVAARHIVPRGKIEPSACLLFAGSNCFATHLLAPKSISRVSSSNPNPSIPLSCLRHSIKDNAFLSRPCYFSGMHGALVLVSWEFGT